MRTTRLVAISVSLLGGLSFPLLGSNVSATPGTYTGLIQLNAPVLPDSMTIDARDVTNTYSAHADAWQGGAGCNAGSNTWCYSIVVESALANSYYLRPIAYISKNNPVFVSSRIPFPPTAAIPIATGATQAVPTIVYTPGEIAGSVEADDMSSTPLQLASVYFSLFDNSNTFAEPCGGSVEFCPFNPVYQAAVPPPPGAGNYQLFLQPGHDYSFLTQAITINEGPLAHSILTWDPYAHYGSLAAAQVDNRNLVLTQVASVGGTAQSQSALSLYNLQVSVSGATTDGGTFVSSYGTTNYGPGQPPLPSNTYLTRIFDNADFTKPFSLQAELTFSQDGQTLLEYPPTPISLSPGSSTYDFSGSAGTITGRVTFSPAYPAGQIYPGVQAESVNSSGGIGVSQSELNTDALGATYTMPVFGGNWQYWRFGLNFNLGDPNFTSNYLTQFLLTPVAVPDGGSAQNEFDFDTALLKVYFTAPQSTTISAPQLDAVSGTLAGGNLTQDGDSAHAEGLNQNSVKTGETRMVLRVHNGTTFRVVPSAMINPNNTPGTGRTDFSPFFITPNKGDVIVVGVPGSVSLTVTSPTDGQVLTSCMIPVTGTATGAPGITITVNGQAVATQNANNPNDANQVTFSTTVPGSGPTSTIVVTASAQNNSPVSRTIQVSSTSAAPPVVTAFVATPTLWSPDHSLVNVGLQAGVSSACDASPNLAIRVYSNEPDLDAGSGNFSPDAKNIGSGSLRLRAERSGSGNGRVYLIAANGTDHFNNSVYACAAVTVPHDQSASSQAAIAAAAAAAVQKCSGKGAIPAGYVQVGVGPVVGPKQ